MRILVVGLIVIIFFLPDVVLAAPEINILSSPGSITAGQEFEVGYSATNLDQNSNYNIKALGGENYTEVDTWNNDWFQQNAAWLSMPIFESGPDGSPSGIFKARFDNETQSGAKDFKIRIKKSDSSTPNIESAVVSISVTAQPPTPTLTQTPIHSTSSIPTPASIHSPTPIPTKSLLKTPKPVDTPDPTPKVLAETTVNSTSWETNLPMESKSQNKNRFPFFAVILILTGLVLIGTAMYVAFRQRLR